MRILMLFLVVVSFVSCIREEDGYCECGPPPGHVEELRILLVNSENENLLSENTNGYIPSSSFTFYMVANNQTSNLTELYKHFDFIQNFGADENPRNEIVLGYSWFLYFNKDTNTKEGDYIIDYNNRFPNDTIHLKYQITKREDSDRILEVKLNGVTQQTDVIDEFYRKLVLVK